jgi:hypothetical protein
MHAPTPCGLSRASPPALLARLQEAGYTEDRFYIHCDGALFGMMMPFLREDAPMVTFKKVRLRRKRTASCCTTVLLRELLVGIPDEPLRHGPASGTYWLRSSEGLAWLLAPGSPSTPAPARARGGARSETLLLTCSVDGVPSARRGPPGLVGRLTPCGSTTDVACDGTPPPLPSQPIGSVSVSGHKFVGAPVPCGVIITR